MLNKVLGKRKQSHSPHQELAQMKPIPSTSLEEWAKTLFNNPEQGSQKNPADEPASVYLSRFGLRNPTDLTKFLRTPAGKTVITEILEKEQLKEAIAHEREIERRDHELFMSRLKMALFMMWLGKKAHASDQLKELIRDQIDKVLHKKPTPEASAPDTAKKIAEYQGLIKGYTKAINDVQARDNALATQEEGLLKQIHDLEQQEQQLLEKYALYEEHAQHDNFDSFLTPEGQLMTSEVQQATDDLTAQMDKLYDEINQVIEEDGDPTHLVQKQNALNLKLGTLHDMLAVHKGDKFYADGEGNEVGSLSKADFVLNKGERIVKDEQGKFYLLQPNQNLDELKLDPHSLQRAAHKAKDAMTVKNVVTDNKGAEEVFRQKRLEDRHSKVSDIRTEKDLIANQLRLLNAARADAEAALQQQQNAPTMSPNPRPGSNMAPTPTPTPMPVSKPTVTLRGRASASTATASVSAGAALKAMKLDEEMTPRAMLDQLKNLPQGNRNMAEEYLKAQLRGIAPNRPIPPALLGPMQERMKQFSGITNPVVQQQPDVQPERTSPSPFDRGTSITPSPFK